MEKLEKAKEAKRRRLEATPTPTGTLPLRLESLLFLSSCISFAKYSRAHAY